MTTQTLLIPAYDYGDATLAVTLRNPDTFASVAVADTTAKNGNADAVIVATFSTLVAGGAYYVELSVDGALYGLYCTLEGVNAEIVTARTDRGVVIAGTLEVTLSEAQQQAIIDSTVNGVTAHRSRIQNAVYGSYTLTAGDTWDQTFDVATAGATRVLVAIKKKITDTDDQSLLLLDDVTGLLRVNKLAAADAAEGEVTADGTTVRAVVDSAATLLIPPGTYSVYVKYLSASRDSTPEYKGELKVEAAGIRIVS